MEYASASTVIAERVIEPALLPFKKGLTGEILPDGSLEPFNIGP